jgi:L-alanine-DL-glutamate epimerase-like enolase superfamily enzyme
MQIDVFVKRLPFVYPFTISGGRSKTEQPAILIRMKHDGYFGFGEACEISYYQTEAYAMAQKIMSVKSILEERFSTHPGEFYLLLMELFPNDSFIRCAIDMAAWDLHGKTIGCSISQIIYGSPPKTVLTDYTLGIDSDEVMKQKMNMTPWPVYKVKVGFEGDSKTLNALRKQSFAKFRLDANGAWGVNEATKFLNSIESSGIELVEQPLSKGSYKEMKELFQILPFQFFADESCISLNDIERCAGYFHGINIKLSKCGGITPAVEMINRARMLKLQIMLGNMNESSIGTAALLQLAAQVDFVDADGPLLLAQDYASGLSYHDGFVNVPDAPGIGIKVQTDLI